MVIFHDEIFMVRMLILKKGKRKVHDVLESHLMLPGTHHVAAVVIENL